MAQVYYFLPKNKYYRIPALLSTAACACLQKIGAYRVRKNSLVVDVVQTHFLCMSVIRFTWFLLEAEIMKVYTIFNVRLSRYE